jgi:hypothetical protein
MIKFSLLTVMAVMLTSSAYAPVDDKKNVAVVSCM